VQPRLLDVSEEGRAAARALPKCGQWQVLRCMRGAARVAAGGSGRGGGERLMHAFPMMVSAMLGSAGHAAAHREESDSSRHLLPDSFMPPSPFF